MDRTARGDPAGDLRPAGSRAVVLTRELVGGAATLVVAGLLAVVVFPPAQPAGRILIVAIACGVLAAILTDPWAIGVVAVAGAVAFVLHWRSLPRNGQAPTPGDSRRSSGSRCWWGRVTAG
jgi:hypothetical protein